jgi:capsular exopolysaccharide synthesis family protein
MYNDRSNLDPVRRVDPVSLVRLGGPSYTPSFSPALESSPEFAEEPAGRNLLEWWRIFRRYFMLLAVLAIIGAVTGYLLTLPQKTMYRARASLQFRTPQDPGQSPTEPGTRPAPGLDETYLQTEIKVLQSEKLAQRVITKLKLDACPDFYSIASVGSRVRKLLGVPVRDPDPSRRALIALQDNLKVRPAGQTRIVEILSDAPDPNLAASIANTLATEFIDQNIEARKDNTQTNNIWLAEQLYDLKSTLELSERSLQQYANSSGLLFTSDTGNVSDERLRQLEAELSKAQAERVSQQSQNELVASSSPDTLPAVLDNEVLHQYRSKLADLRRELAELTNDLTPNHYKVKRQQAQIAEMESALDKERDNIIARMLNQYRASMSREATLKSAYNDQAKEVLKQSEKSIRYNILKHEMDANRQLYESMLQRVKDSHIQSAMAGSNIMILDSATAPLGPYSPDRPLEMFLGLLCGLSLAIGLVVVRESTDKRLRHSAVAAKWLNVRELGAIPRADHQSTGDLDRGIGGSVRVILSGGQRQPVELVTWHQKPSPMAESFRTALASILFSRSHGERPRVVVFTSPNPGEGKSTVVSNLGIALAEVYQRVVIVDSDIRRPRMNQIFDAPNTWGLSNLLRERMELDTAPLEALSRKTQVPGLYLIPSGPGATRISNLFYSARMEALLTRLKKDFDMVLIDTCPMMRLPDARILGRLSDGVVLVLRAGQTARDAALAARRRLEEDGTRIIGALLNDWNPRAEESYTSYTR